MDRVQNRYWLFGYMTIILIAGALRFVALTDIPYTLFGDEAWFEVRGREILQGIDLLPTVDPVFQSGNSPFQIYATAFVQAIGFPAVYSSRWVSATAGLLSVAFLYPCLLWLLRRDFASEFRHLAALVATAVMATLFIGILLSRDGRQNPLCTVMTILVVMGTYRAFDRVSLKWAVVAGALLALAQTTYEAALGLPILVIAYTIVRLLQPNEQKRSTLVLIGGLILLAGLFFYAPFLYYYSLHPEVALNKLSSVTAMNAEQSGLATTLVRVISGYIRVWSGIFLQGDILPTQNLPGRPLFDPFVSFLFVIGFVGALVHARRSTGIQLLLVWAIIMALPSAATVIPPAFPRSLPMTPALAGFAGVGAALFARLAVHRYRERGPWAITLVMSVGLLFSGVSTVRDYWRWTQDPIVQDAFHVYGRYTIERVLDLAEEGDVWITTRSSAYLLYPLVVTVDDQPSVLAFDASTTCLPYAHQRPAATTYSVIQVMDHNSLSVLKENYPTGREVDWIMHNDGYAYAVFFQVPPHTMAPSPSHPLNVTFAGGLQLTGFDVDGEMKPGGQLTLRLYWRTLEPLVDNLVGFVHVGKGANSHPMIAQSDAPLCPGLPTSQWRTGYVYIEERILTLDNATLPDLYDIRVGVYPVQSSARLPIMSTDLPNENNRVVITPLDVSVTQ